MRDSFGLFVFRVEEGLGNACAVRLPDGAFGIVDWGTESVAARESLVRLIGDSKVAFVAATHPHADHTLGLSGLLERLHGAGVGVGRLVFPATTLHRPGSALTEARRTARALRIPQSAVTRVTLPGSVPPLLAFGGAGADRFDVTVLAPQDVAVGVSEVSAAARAIVPGNETSLVLLFRFLGSAEAEGRAVLPGDASPATLQAARSVADDFPELHLGNVACLVPHHGSRGNLPAWFVGHLRAVSVISCPTDSMHHPHADVLRALAARPGAGGGGIFCTSYAGACRADRSAGGPLRLVSPGPCFGDLELEVPRTGPVRVRRFSGNGDQRRPYGYCG